MSSGRPNEQIQGGQIKPCLINNKGFPKRRKSVTFDHTSNASNDFNFSSDESAQETLTASSKMSSPRKRSRSCQYNEPKQDDAMVRLMLELEHCIPKMHDQYRIVNEKYQDCCISLKGIYKTLQEHHKAFTMEPSPLEADKSPILKKSGHKRTSVDNRSRTSSTSSGHLSSSESAHKKCKDRSTLTLRYPEKDRGLEELAEGTGVYIKIANLKKCRSDSRNGTELALGLMVEIFSKSALKECSLYEDKSRKIPLDRIAVNTIMDYVKNRARVMKWSIDENDIEKSMKTKLQNSRHR